MGKGDKKTKRGKIFSKSYGKHRPKPKKLRKIDRENNQENSKNKKEDKE